MGRDDEARYDSAGFDCLGIHRDTGAPYGPDRYDRDGFLPSGYDRQKGSPSLPTIPIRLAVPPGVPMMMAMNHSGQIAVRFTQLTGVGRPSPSGLYPDGCRIESSPPTNTLAGQSSCTYCFLRVWCFPHGKQYV